VYFDTHSHLTLSDLPIDEHLKACEREGVKFILDPGIHPSDFYDRRDKLSPYPNVLLGVAYAPHEVNHYKAEDLEKLEEIIRNERVAAISEIGLEYHYFKEGHKKQKEVFSHQLEMAKTYHLPVFLHIREAFDDAYETVKESKAASGAVHSFTGTREDARRFLDLGFHISFSGIVTFKNARLIQEALLYVPMDRLLTETDAPYLAPVPMRGKKNTSPYIKYTHAFIAESKGMDEEEMNRIIFDNASRLLGTLS